MYKILPDFQLLTPWAFWVHLIMFTTQLLGFAAPVGGNSCLLRTLICASAVYCSV